MSNSSESGTMIIEQAGLAEAPLLVAVAGEIRAIRMLVERLAELLVSDVRFATDYIDQFQVFDLMSQCADESASVLERLADGLSADEAVARVRLTTIQQRLHAAITKE
jgi:hypothetical protein